MIDNTFIEHLPDDVYDALLLIVERFDDFNRSVHQKDASDRFDFYNDYIQFFSLVTAFNEVKNLGLILPELLGHEHFDIEEIQKYFDELGSYARKNRISNRLTENKSAFIELFSSSFCYEFTDYDLQRVQVLINELRDLISASEVFDEKHKFRLLKRLERLQNEVHKKVSDLDRFWGLIGDAGVAIGKFGKDVKPIVDRIKELTTITWRTQSKAEKLPSDSPIPLLDDNDEE